MASSVSVGFIAAWQVLFVAALVRRHTLIGISALVYTLGWYLLLIWADALRAGVAPLLSTAEVVSIAFVYRQAPRGSQSKAYGFAILGAASASYYWISGGWTHSRVVIASFVAAAVLILGLSLFFTGNGKIPFRLPINKSAAALSANGPLRYSYWSQRAIESVMSESSSSRSRAQITPTEIGFLTAKFSFERSAPATGRAAEALELEREFAGHIHSVETIAPGTDRFLLSGRGTIHVNAYGTGSVDDDPLRHRVTIFANQVTENGKKIAICLFGSMDNFDASIQDIHPQRVDGWALSSIPGVMRWMQNDEAWDESRWGESVGNTAYKIAQPDGPFFTPSQNYARVRVMKQDEHGMVSARLSCGGTERPHVIPDRPSRYRAPYLGALTIYRSNVHQRSKKSRT